MIAAGTALDVIEIDAASNTGVDNIRELIERSQFAPVQCRYKVYVLDEVHMLSAASFNALLKTLEEPPDRVVFILATTDPQRVLPTIISRCQKFDFRRIELQAMVQHLQTIAHKEDILITNEAITLVAQIAQGGLRDAESLLDQLSLAAEEVTIEQVWNLVGAVPEQDLLAILAAIAANDPEALLDHTHRLLDRGREPLTVLQNLASFYRDLLIAKTAPSRNDLVALTSSTWQALCEAAQPLEMAAILAGQQLLRSSEVQLRNTTQPRLWLEVTLMGLLPAGLQSPPIAPQPAIQSSQLSRPVAATPPIAAVITTEPTTTPTKPLLVPEPAKPALPDPAIAPAATEADSTNLDETWKQILSLVVPVSTQMMLRQQCMLLEFDGQAARIGARSDKLFKMAKDRLPQLEAAFDKCYQQKIKITFEVISASEIPASPAIAEVTTAIASPKSIKPHPAPSETTISTTITHPAIASPEPKNALPLPTVPEVPVPPATWGDEDETTKAARAFAEAFGSEVIDMTDDFGELAPVEMMQPETIVEPPAPIWEEVEEESDSEIDVPF